MKRLMFLLLFVGIVGMINAIDMRDIVYITRYDTLDLYMTIYEPIELQSDYVILYMHGGAFISGSRNDSMVVEYCTAMSERGFRVVAIDYRLRMEGFRAKGIMLVQTLQNAIYQAVEDCSAAVAYLIEKEGIDSDKVILVGSSAGAIIALQTDYLQSNGCCYTALLPDTLRFAGVVAYSGAILTTSGWVDYARRPAPTMLFHGTKDNIVTYNKIEMFGYGFYGSNSLVRRLKKYNCPYYIRRYEGLSHEVCLYGLETIHEVEYFIQKYIVEKKDLIIDEMYKDRSVEPKIGYYNQLRRELMSDK